MRGMIAVLLCLACPVVAVAQTAVYWQGGYGERWTSPGSVVSHIGAIKPCDAGVSDETCPRSAAWGEGAFRLNGRIYSVVGGKRIGPGPGDPNYQGDIRYYNTDPDYVGDHLDCYVRLDSDGTYERALDFLHLPPNRYMHTLSDASVRQEDSSLPLPSAYAGTTTSQGTDWQIGSGFAPVVGPRLASDPLNSHRVYAFFAPESYPGDQGVGGHMIGFASINVPDSATTFTFPSTSIWKDATSPNDGDYKANAGLRLRTLYLREFTPVIAFRGDAGLWSSNDDPLLDTPVTNGRYIGGVSAWYTSGYFYVLIGVTALSTGTPPACTNASYPGESHPRYKPGMLLMRIKADVTGSQGFRGLWLDAAKKPQISLYRVAGDNPGQWVAVPSPDQLVSFQEDEKSWGCVGGYNRLYYQASGSSLASGNNPREYGYHFNVTYPSAPEQTLPQPSAAFTLSDECTHYVVVTDFLTEPTTARILRVTQENCSAGGASVSFSHAAQIEFPSPGAIDGIPYSDGGLWPGWPNLVGFDGGTWLGFRTTSDGGLPDGLNSIASFTVTPNLYNCSFHLASTSLNSGPGAATGSLVVNAPETRCVWSVTSDASFVTVTSPNTGLGSTTVTYSVAANTTGVARVAHVSVGGQTFTVTQSGAAAATVAFSQSVYWVTERAGMVALSVTRSGDVSGSASVALATANGSAVAGSNYAATSLTISFGAGETSKTLMVPIIDNSRVEGKRTFYATMFDPTGASLGAPTTAVVDIIDDDTVSSDFSATPDGRRDMVWRNASTGGTRVWLFDGVTATTAFNLPSNSTQLSVAGVADFNADGHADVLWRSSNDGALTLWYMNGVAVLSTVAVSSPSGTDWFVAAVGDLNADGYPDILWRNSNTFEDVVWLMHDTVHLSTAALPTVNDVNWRVYGIGDFNRDHKNDIVWRHDPTTKCAVWLMDGTTFSSATYLPNVGAPWILVGVGDMNGDGDADLLWQTTTTRQLALWQMNETSFGSSYFLGTSVDQTTASDPQWSIVAPR